MRKGRAARWPRTVARPVARPLVPMARRLRPWTRWRRCPTATPWDADAVSHLEDCNGLITGLSSYLGMIGVAALIIALVLGFRKQFAALAFMLRMGSALLLAVLVVLGLWGVIDFNGLFAAFHSLFFVDGTWTFNYDSLLISMYPIDFWMGMGAVWVGSAIGVGLLCFAAGCPVRVEGPGAAPRVGRGRRGRRRPLQEAPQEGPQVAYVGADLGQPSPKRDHLA